VFARNELQKQKQLTSGYFSFRSKFTISMTNQCSHGRHLHSSLYLFVPS
jgi:hypothetical protein